MTLQISGLWAPRYCCVRWFNDIILFQQLNIFDVTFFFCSLLVSAMHVIVTLKSNNIGNKQNQTQNKTGKLISAWPNSGRRGGLPFETFTVSCPEPFKFQKISRQCWSLQNVMQRRSYWCKYWIPKRSKSSAFWLLCEKWYKNFLGFYLEQSRNYCTYNKIHSMRSTFEETFIVGLSRQKYILKELDTNQRKNTGRILCNIKSNDLPEARCSTKILPINRKY